MILAMQGLYGGIELGGTKAICAVGNASGELVARRAIPTTTVEDTLAAVYGFFASQDPLIAIGVGTFGPLNLVSSSPDYGTLGNTPKEGWTNIALKSMLEHRIKLPVAIDLDVNCAALGELHYGAAQDVHNFVYLTIGTGIGGGLIMDEHIIHGVLNLEMGHMRIPHEPFNDSFRGVCPYHGDCFEGIASGYAMQKRYDQKAEELADPAIWDLEAQYVAYALNNIMMNIGPERIILGGGVSNHAGLIESIRPHLHQAINKYLSFPPLDTYVVRASSEDNGVRGAIKLASQL